MLTNLTLWKTLPYMIKLHSMTGTTDYINKNQQVFNVSFMHLEVKRMQIRIFCTSSYQYFKTFFRGEVNFSLRMSGGGGNNFFGFWFANSRGNFFYAKVYPLMINMSHLANVAIARLWQIILIINKFCAYSVYLNANVPILVKFGKSFYILWNLRKKIESHILWQINSQI